MQPNPSPQAAVVCVVDDDPSIRKNVARLLRSAGLETCGFGSAERFLRTREFRRPACVLLDVSMPGLDGLAVQDELRRRGLTLPIVFVSGHGSVPIATRAMKSGAVDFIEKPFQSDQLLKLVADALERDRHQCAEAAARTEVSALYTTLSPREREVMSYVIRGFLNKQIAAELGISIATVKCHRACVMEKMKTESVPGLVYLAEQIGVWQPVAPALASF